MRKRLPIRRSSAATYSRFAGVVAIPVIVLGAMLHRSGHIDTTTLFAILSVGFALALSAVVASGIGLLAVWQRGARGTGAALRGLFFGLIALAPALVVAGAVIYYPRLTDISTDLETPPALEITSERPEGESDLQPDLQKAAYPDIVPRRFPVGTAQLFAAVDQVIKSRGWTVAQQLAPAMNDDPGAIQVETHSLLLGFIDDMTVRIRPDPIGARMDIRSASRVGAHDLGANARRIRGFLESVDAVLTEAYGITDMPESDTAPVEGLPEEYEKLNEPEIPVPGDKPGAALGETASG